MTSELREILASIDEIKDDKEFCEAEHRAIIDFCCSHDFCLEQVDCDEIEARGYDLEEISYYYG